NDVDGGGEPDVPAPSGELDPSAPDLIPVGAPGGQWAWETARANSANTGFARVDTAPAVTPQRVSPVGLVAPGANPVVPADGTVYIGTLAGELHAFHADGTPFWTREINNLHGGFFAAPAVGADGSIYAVSSVHYTDHRGGVTRQRNDSFLHKFSPGGAWLFATPFPEQSPEDPSFADGGATTAPPNIWRANGTEVLMVPVVYTTHYYDLRLIAFSTDGAVLGDVLVTRISELGGPLTAGGSIAIAIGDCIDETWWTLIGPLLCPITAPITEYCCAFTKTPITDEFAVDLLPGVAIRPDPRGGPPLVVLSDHRQDK